MYFIGKLRGGASGMNPEIGTLHARMAQGGDWLAFRNEIAQLHREAATQEEFVSLLEAHRNLVAVAEHCFSPEKCAEIREIAAGEYKMFLTAEALENGQVNPVMLDHITAREVQSGRLGADDEFRKLAEAGVLLGDSAAMRYDRKLGNYVGIVGAAFGAISFFLLSKAAGIAVFVIAIGGGWLINEHRRRGALGNAQLDRHSRGYE